MHPLTEIKILIYKKKIKRHMYMHYISIHIYEQRSRIFCLFSYTMQSDYFTLYYF